MLIVEFLGPILKIHTLKIHLEVGARFLFGSCLDAQGNKETRNYLLHQKHVARVALRADSRCGLKEPLNDLPDLTKHLICF